MSADKILTFWFETLSPKQWWAKDAELDARITKEFSDIHQQAVSGRLTDWRQTPRGRLAEIIILDQFSRNIFRDQPKSFQYDEQALACAREAIEAGDDQLLSMDERAFVYLPFMHSESAAVHEEALVLFSQKGLEHNLAFEKSHKDIIDRFGRYPHRNAILGRESTPEELQFLRGPNSSF